MNLIRISTVPGGTVQTKTFGTNQKKLDTNSNLLRNARWNLRLSSTGAVSCAMFGAVEGALPSLSNGWFGDRIFHSNCVRDVNGLSIGTFKSIKRRSQLKFQINPCATLLQIAHVFFSQPADYQNKAREHSPRVRSSRQD